MVGEKVSRLSKKVDAIWPAEVTDNDNFETLLKRFNRKVQEAGILSEIRRREFFEKPSIKRKQKETTKRRKSSRTPKNHINL